MGEKRGNGEGRQVEVEGEKGVINEELLNEE